MPEFREMLVPLGTQNRTGKKIPHLRFITIHEASTGTELAPAYKNVDYYISKIMCPPEKTRFVGYHYLVSDTVVIKFMNDTDFTCHAGKFGNRSSLGIERLVFEGLDHNRAVWNQALVAATLMRKHNIPLKNVVPHKFWPPTKTKDFKFNIGKECPSRLLAGMFGGWEGFLDKVNECYENELFLVELF